RRRRRARLLRLTEGRGRGEDETEADRAAEQPAQRAPVERRGADALRGIVSAHGLVPRRTRGLHGRRPWLLHLARWTGVSLGGRPELVDLAGRLLLRLGVLGRALERLERSLRVVLLEANHAEFEPCASIVTQGQRAHERLRGGRVLAPLV